MDLELWEDIVEALGQAEKRWEKQLQETNTSAEEKPDILYLGPKPRKIKSRKAIEEEIKYEIFPLPKPWKNRGDFVNRCKKELTLLNLTLAQEANEDRRKQIEAKRSKVKAEIKAYRKQKKNNKKKSSTTESIK